MPFDEPTAQKAIARILTADGKKTLGTGFFIDRSGRLLSCVHVVGDGPVRVRDSEGIEHDGVVRDEHRDVTRDLALVETNAAPPAVFPVADDRSVPNPVWTSGFVHSNVRGIESAFATTGSVTSGQVTVTHDKFELRNALILDGIEVGPGLSGSPVVALPEGVVIGVVNSDFREFAFAIPPYSAVSPAIQDALSINDRETPRYGRYLNLAGLRELAAAQARVALRRLEAQRQYLPEQYVERTSVDSLWADFLAGDKKVLPIVGSSGMGKTSLLAHLLGSGRVDPAVMVPAYRIDFTSPLQDALLAAFADAVEPFDATTVQNVEQALRKAKRELVFILDGLNEARATAAELRPWLERSMEWLRKAPVRLIVSCRTDFWRLVSEDIPRDLTFEQNASMRSVNVEWFSEEEVKAAISAYRLPPAARGLRALRNPLLVRLYWALGEKTGTGRVDAYTLLDGFADEISRTVAKRLDGMSEGIVRAKLVALTGLMDASLNIDAHEFAEAFASEPRLRDVLFRENVVVDAGSTAFRFLFDELAEFLIGSTRTLPTAKDERAWLPLFTSRNALASLRYTFIRLEREGRVAEIRTALSRMIATLYSGNTFLLDLALQEIVSNLSDPRPYFDLILEMVRKSASPRRSAYGTSAFVALPHTLTLEPPQRLALLRELFPAERDYWWKLKTWRREGPHMLSWPQSLAAALADLILRDPKTTFAALAEWLDDTRPLAGSSAFPEATVSDVAQCFLFWFRERAFDQVCDIAAEHEREGNHLLFMLVESDPHRVLGAVERWKTRPELHEIAAHVANRLASIATIDQTRLRRALESLLAQKVTAVVRTTATAALARVSPDPGAHVEQLLGAFLRDDPAALPASLPLADPRYTAKVLDAFARYLKRGKDDDRKQDILNNLDFVAERGTPGEQLLIAEMVADLKPSKALAIAYGSSIERLLHIFPAGSRAFATLLDVATRILRKGPVDAQGYVIHAATSPRMEPEKRGDQKRLIEIVMAKDDRDAKVELRAALAAYPDLFEQTMEWMLALTEDIEGTRFGEGLCWTAYMHEDFGRLFASWAVTQPESSLSGFALGLKRDIGRGRTPKDVLQEHLPEMMR